MMQVSSHIILAKIYIT